MLTWTTGLISDLIHLLKCDSNNFLLKHKMIYICPKIYAQCLIWNSNIRRYQEPAMPKCKLVFELSNRVSDSSTSILCTRHRAQLVLLLQSLLLNTPVSYLPNKTAKQSISFWIFVLCIQWKYIQWKKRINFEMIKIIKLPLLKFKKMYPFVSFFKSTKHCSIKSLLR